MTVAKMALAYALAAAIVAGSIYLLTAPADVDPMGPTTTTTNCHDGTAGGVLVPCTVKVSTVPAITHVPATVRIGRRFTVDGRNLQRTEHLYLSGNGGMFTARMVARYRDRIEAVAPRAAGPGEYVVASWSNGSGFSNGKVTHLLDGGRR